MLSFRVPSLEDGWGAPFTLFGANERLSAKDMMEATNPRIL
ncbi:MAG: hypothetical protein ACRENH_14765 [Gemmatimonadaceae bacterium]